MPTSTICLLNPHAHNGRTARLEPALAAALQQLAPKVPLVVAASIKDAQAVIAAQSELHIQILPQALAVVRRQQH